MNLDEHRHNPVSRRTVFSGGGNFPRNTRTHMTPSRRLRRAASSSLLALLIIVMGGCTSSNPEDATKDGVAAATSWLELIDAGKYNDAWAASADEIKTAGPVDAFAKMMEQTRGPLGNEKSRTVKDQGYAKDPQNAPPGEYVQIHFDSSFENAKSATELVIVKKQPDGVWKVGQYSVNPE